MAKHTERSRPLPESIEPQSFGTAAVAKHARSKETYWRHFPHFEKALTSDNPDVLRNIEATCRQLDAISKTGSRQEQERARVAMTAYARSLELHRLLTDLRDRKLAAGNKQEFRTDK